ncbi:MAG: hypothetical protein L0K08_07295, partial [Bifidobacterium mongoliense]|nr:hypothetical protein [Bifidobacterium mongoliense]
TGMRVAFVVGHCSPATIVCIIIVCLFHHRTRTVPSASTPTGSHDAFRRHPGDTRCDQESTVMNHGGYAGGHT